MYGCTYGGVFRGSAGMLRLHITCRRWDYFVLACERQDYSARYIFIFMFIGVIDKNPLLFPFFFVRTTNTIPPLSKLFTSGWVLASRDPRPRRLGYSPARARRLSGSEEHRPGMWSVLRMFARY